MANGAVRGIVIFGASGWKDGCGRSLETQYSVMTAAAEEMAFAYVFRGKRLLFGTELGYEVPFTRGAMLRRVSRDRLFQAKSRIYVSAILRRWRACKYDVNEVNFDHLKQRSIQ